MFKNILNKLVGRIKEAGFGTALILTLFGLWVGWKILWYVLIIAVFCGLIALADKITSMIDEADKKQKGEIGDGSEKAIAEDDDEEINLSE